MERYLGILLIMFISFLAGTVFPTKSVLGESVSDNTLPANQPVVTKSSFTEKLQEETEVISKKIIYEDDPETEAGEEKVLDEGSDGKKVKIIKITYSNDGEEYLKELVSTEITPAKDKKILRGTKIVWKTLQTADGEIKYWKKIHVKATQYDSRCLGCNAWTAIGLPAGHGVIAVDPKVIPLGSWLYIPGYGKAIAGDTGGGVKGSMIDLGFEDTRTSGWYTHSIDIYLL